jgi:adenylate cyclase
MIRIYVANKVERVTFEHGSGPLELGRGPGRELPRRMIQDLLVSKDQLRIEALPGDRLRLESLSQKVAVILANGQKIKPGEFKELDLPVRFTVGETLIEVSPIIAAPPVDPLALRTIERPVTVSSTSETMALPSLHLDKATSNEQFARWLETVVAVQRSAASSSEFYEETARAVVELIGLDCGFVLLGEGDGEREGAAWDVVARHPPQATLETMVSRAVLERVRHEQRTYYQVLTGGTLTATVSMQGLGAVVAAPIFADPGDRVVGVVYGARRLRGGESEVAIRPLEAQLVQVLATAAGAGLARLSSEKQAARRLVQLEQFFSPNLVQELVRDTTLLEGRKREVTVLFVDIRGFSRIAERLDPGEACQLVGDLMEQVTSRVHDHRGVVVDYYGDGLLALWNAPVEQPDHALLACRAALAILAELPGLNARWGKRIGGTLGLGIGLNTGSALVGNTGSRTKLKYGPLGHTVNLASRVEGATRQLGVPILITEWTYKRLAGALAARRICKVRVAGIAGAVDLYELYPPEAEGPWRVLGKTYEEGLAHFEAGRWDEAYQVLNTLLVGPEGRRDLPTLSLLGRTIECLKSQPQNFDPVLELSSK